MPQREHLAPAAEAADGDALVEMARLTLAGHRDDIRHAGRRGTRC